MGEYASCLKKDPIRYRVAATRFPHDGLKWICCHSLAAISLFPEDGHAIKGGDKAGAGADEVHGRSDGIVFRLLLMAQTKQAGAPLMGFQFNAGLLA
ncbi:MAG: hypothetical protein U0X75_21680 [Acidobacteriota bacterium]